MQVESVQRPGGPEEGQSELGSGSPELPPGVQRDQVLDQREDQGTEQNCTTDETRHCSSDATEEEIE